VQAGSDEEIHLYWVIATLGQEARWGSEADLIVQTAFPPKGGGAAPKGRVTLRIDGQGNATAVLVGAGVPTVPAAFSSIDDAKKGLVAAFGLKSVVDGDATWSLVELNKVDLAFKKLSAGERAALKGVILERMHNLEEKGKVLGGKFTTNHSLGADNKTPTSEAKLSLADLAFTADLTSFIGGSADSAPASVQTILHEVGHAVEEAERYQTREAKFKAQAEENKKIEAFNAEVATTNAAISALNGELSPAIKKANGYPNPAKTAAGAYLKAIQAATSALGKFANNRKSADDATLSAAAAKAIANRDTERAALQTATPANPAPADFASVETKQNDLQAAAAKRATALAAMDTAKAAATAATKADDATQTGGQTKRLANFAAFVKKEKIEPLTEYAKTGTGEFYAEAFSLFRGDPQYILRVAPKLHAWFDKGEHLK